jgi:Na+/proline symporter
MKLNIIDITILVVYFLAMIGIGIAVMKKASKSLDSYFLAGHALSHPEFQV